jgi:hypothetical protein
LVLEEQIWDLRICDGFLYYRITESQTATDLPPTIKFYRLSIEGGTPEQTNLLPFFHGEYQLEFIPNPETLYSGAFALTNGLESVPLIHYQDATLFYSNFCIGDGKFWILHTCDKHSGTLSSIDLTTGEVYEYHLSGGAIKEGKHDLEEIECFTVLDGILYAISKGQLCYYDYEKEELVPILNQLIVPEIPINYRGLGYIYNDGTYLYSYEVMNLSILTIHRTLPMGDGTFMQDAIIN